MRIVFIIPLLCSASLLFAEEEAPASETGKLKDALGSLLKKIDKNGDGKLDDTEKEALHSKMKKEILDRYDTDRDGKLSDEEKARAKADGQAKMGKNGKETSDLERKARAEFNKRFDKDGDGKLNEEEKKAALEAARKLRKQAESKDAAPAPTPTPK